MIDALLLFYIVQFIVFAVLAREKHHIHVLPDSPAIWTVQTARLGLHGVGQAGQNAAGQGGTPRGRRSVLPSHCRHPSWPASTSALACLSPAGHDHHRLA
jgi:hypothetical protein